MGTSTEFDAVNPFPSPFSTFSANLSPDAIIPLIFLGVFTLWFVFTLTAIYHWFRYGHRSWLAVPAIGLHVFVSGFLMLYMMSGLR